MARSKNAVIEALSMRTVKNGCTPEEEATAKAKIVELMGQEPAKKKHTPPTHQHYPEPPKSQFVRAPAFPYKLRFENLTKADLALVKERFHWRMTAKKSSEVQDILVSFGYNEGVYRDDASMMDVWSFRIEGAEGKYWIMHFGNSGTYFLHGDLEVFQKMFQRPIFPFA